MVATLKPVVKTVEVESYVLYASLKGTLADANELTQQLVEFSDAEMIAAGLDRRKIMSIRNAISHLNCLLLSTTKK